MAATQDTSDLARGAVRRQQQRQTAVNLLLLLALGTATTALAMAGVVPVRTAIPGPGRLAAEIACGVLLFDAYFYALHRLLHTRPGFRWVHAVHHRARDVDVWSTIAMHPLEFVLLIGFVPAAMCLLPVHLVSVAAVSVTLSTCITLAHSGRAIVPVSWERTPLLDVYLTPRTHAAHHARLHCNYGATVTLFDRLFGTLRSADGGVPPGQSA